ncbi:hypothetical protein, partial [Streptomyces sp. NPDC002547]
MFDEDDKPEPPPALEQWLWDEDGNIKQRPAAIADQLLKLDSVGDLGVAEVRCPGCARNLAE